MALRYLEVRLTREHRDEPKATGTPRRATVSQSVLPPPTVGNRGVPGRP